MNFLYKMWKSQLHIYIYILFSYQSLLKLSTWHFWACSIRFYLKRKMEWLHFRVNTISIVYSYQIELLFNILWCHKVYNNTNYTKNLRLDISPSWQNVSSQTQHLSNNKSLLFSQETNWWKPLGDNIILPHDTVIMIWQGTNMAKIFCIFVCDQITIFIDYHFDFLFCWL